MLDSQVEELQTSASLSLRAAKASASMNSVSASSDAASNTVVDAIMTALSGAESDLQGSVQATLKQGSGILSLSGQLSALIPPLQSLGQHPALTGSGLQSRNETDVSTAVADLEALLASKSADVSRLSEALEVQSRELEEAQSRLKDGGVEAEQLRASAAEEGDVLRAKIHELSLELEAQHVTAQKLEAELTACRASLVESQSRLVVLEEKGASQQAESRAAAGDEVRICRAEVNIAIFGVQWLNPG